MTDEVHKRERVRGEREKKKRERIKRERENGINQSKTRLLLSKIIFNFERTGVGFPVFNIKFVGVLAMKESLTNRITPMIRKSGKYSISFNLNMSTVMSHVLQIYKQ